jgi:hypothetical protein
MPFDYCRIAIGFPEKYLFTSPSGRGRPVEDWTGEGVQQTPRL